MNILYCPSFGSFPIFVYFRLTLDIYKVNMWLLALFTVYLAHVCSADHPVIQNPATNARPTGIY